MNLFMFCCSFPTLWNKAASSPGPYCFPCSCHINGQEETSVGSRPVSALGARSQVSGLKKKYWGTGLGLGQFTQSSSGSQMGRPQEGGVVENGK